MLILDQANHPLDLVVASQDGARAVRLTQYEGLHHIENRRAVGAYFRLSRPGDTNSRRLAVVFSDLFDLATPEELGLPADMPRKVFQMECAYASIGEYLDSDGTLPETPSGEGAIKVECFSAQLETWEKRTPADEGAVLQYLCSKAYWSWRSDLASTLITAADSIRLRNPIRTIARIAQLGAGDLWNIESAEGPSFRLTPMPALIRAEHDKRQRRKAGTDASVTLLLSAPRYDGPSMHWQKARDFSESDQPDYANAAKEAICAVEGLARIITVRHTDTLGELIKELKRNHSVNPAMAKTLEGLWGFTSNEPGVRHGSPGPATIGASEARYVLDSSEAAIRFLLTLDRQASA